MIRIFIFSKLLLFGKNNLALNLSSFFFWQHVFIKYFLLFQLFYVNFSPLHNLGIAILTQTNETPYLHILLVLNLN